SIYLVTDQTSGGAILALNPDGTEKWKYQTAGEIPDGGVVLAADGTVYANGGCKPSAGLVALNSDGTLKWHYQTDENVQTSPVLDDRGYIHFVAADATYYVLKPDGTLFSSLKLGDSTISSPVMDAYGNLYIAVIKDGVETMVCASSKASSYAMDSPWPMRGQNPQRTSLQK
ncbi:MAG: PQQ-binding-like beta-propeller repeat protein, partial [Parabacteroides sp.]|nr:PQQ-binding-like beta-propeller repeat protein [Parabacteroides sp.]